MESLLTEVQTAYVRYCQVSSSGDLEKMEEGRSTVFGCGRLLTSSESSSAPLLEQGLPGSLQI